MSRLLRKSRRRHRAARLEPTAGNWYVDKSGTLFKVRALVYVGGRLNHAVIDYSTGEQRLLPISRWNRLLFESESAD